MVHAPNGTRAKWHTRQMAHAPNGTRAKWYRRQMAHTPLFDTDLLTRVRTEAEASFVIEHLKIGILHVLTVIYHVSLCKNVIRRRCVTDRIISCSG
jgi:hypothetical protein